MAEKAEKKIEAHYKAWRPQGTREQVPLPVALIKDGEEVLPGQIKVFDILLLPKAYAEVAQVIAVVEAGTKQEAWDLVPLPSGPPKKDALPWRVTLKTLNGPPDQTGAHRPIGVIRLGETAPQKGSTVLVMNKGGKVELVTVNVARSTSMVTVGLPVNIPLFTVAKKLPVAAVPPQKKD